MLAQKEENVHCYLCKFPLEISPIHVFVFSHSAGYFLRELRNLFYAVVRNVRDTCCYRFIPEVAPSMYTCESQKKERKLEGKRSEGKTSGEKTDLDIISRVGANSSSLKTNKLPAKRQARSESARLKSTT